MSPRPTRMSKSAFIAVPVLIFLLVVAHAPPASATVNPVGPIVADIASLPAAQGDSCQGVITAVQGGGQVEQYLNQGLGTNFRPVAVSGTECKVLVSFVPVIGTYNGLVVAAQNYNPNNRTSVDDFYEQAFLVAAEVTVVGFALNGVLYEASFSATGQLNDGLQLGKLRAICGDACYSDVLSSLYWFIKGTASGALDGFLSWATPYLPVADLPKLPAVCKVPILGNIFSAFGLMGCKR